MSLSMEAKNSAKNGLVLRSILVFLVVFGLNQASIIVSASNPSFAWSRSLTFFMIAAIAFFLMRHDGLEMKDHGFFFPKNSGRLLALSLFLAFLYVLIVLFVPGATSQFEVLPGVPWTLDALFTIGNVLLATVATVTVFQGYFQTSFNRKYESSTTIAVVTVMFTLFTLPATMYLTSDPAVLFRDVILVVAQSVFLCYFFLETETNFTVMTFGAAVLLLRFLTPLEATSADSVALFSVLVYIFFVPIMHTLVDEVKQQTLRQTPIPVYEPDEP